MFPMMEAESDSSTRSGNFSAAIRVLLVDDDLLFLKIAAATLQACKYEVVTVTRATDALNMLHEKRGGFDLVLSDVHMPIMNGFDLLAIVKKKFKIPVILFSADSTMEGTGKAMKCGASFCFTKPIIKSSTQNFWQFVMRKESKTSISKQPALTIDKQPVNRRRVVEVEESLKSGRSEDGENSSSVNAKKAARKKDKKVTTKRPEEEGDDEDDEDNVPQKKARMVWTTHLHEKFVQAVNSIGIKNAVPKKIIQVMKVKGVSRTNIASHLQKYRLYLKGNKEQSTSSKFWDPGYAAAPSLSQFYNQGVSRYGHSARTLCNDRNIRRQWMSSRNMNLSSLDNTGFKNQGVDTSSYGTNYVGLQLCDGEGMIGVRQTGLNGGLASNFSTNLNPPMNDVSIGDGHAEAIANTPIPTFDSINFNQAAGGYSSDMIMNQNVDVNQFQVAPQLDAMNFNQIQVEEEQQQELDLDSWSEIITNTSTHELSGLLWNEGGDQENVAQGLTMDSLFDISELQFDGKYPLPNGLT